jgi:hypothetical protein
MRDVDDSCEILWRRFGQIVTTLGMHLRWIEFTDNWIAAGLPTGARLSASAVPARFPMQCPLRGKA